MTAVGQLVKSRFDLAEYRDSKAVEATRSGVLTVCFADGDVATVNGKKLVREPKGLCWTNAHVDPE